MKRFIFYVILILFQLTFFSCTDEWRRGRGSETWLSTEPANIPYNIRMKEFKSGNLVGNPSFEEGTPLTSDTSTVQVIKKWEIIGKNVKYIENRGDSVLAIEGKRTVLIQRTEFDETDEQGEGVLSDYIPVIPGKYEMDLLIKAKNITPYLERHGTRLFDAINIRLMFYDDRKREVSSAMYDPVSGMTLDIGMKSNNFSGYYTFDEPEWTRIYPRSCDNPMIDGLLPPDTRFIRIFIGLKGTGTLMIDDVNFTYSSMNFTSKERMNRMKDSLESQKVLLTPVPRFAEFKQSISLISAGTDKVLYPAVVLKIPETRQNNFTFQLLTDTLKSVLLPFYPDCHIHSQNEINQTLTDNSSVIFILTSFEHYDTLSHADYLQGFSQKKQAYIINDTLINGKHHIFLAASDDTGLYYAVQTLSGLLDPVNGMLHLAHIIDYPAFATRGFLLPDVENDDPENLQQQLIRLFAANRFNKAYLPLNFYFSKTGHFLNENNTTRYSLYDHILNYPVIHPGLFLNFYDHSDDVSSFETAHRPVDQKYFPDDKQFQALFVYLKPFFDKEVNHLMMNFMNGDQKTQMTMIQAIHNWLKLNHPATYPELMARWRTNSSIIMSRGNAVAFFNEISSSVSSELGVAWSGLTDYFTIFDQTDYNKFAEITRQRIIMNFRYPTFELKRFLGSAPVYNSGQARLINIFSPFFTSTDILFSSTFHEFLVNPTGNSEIDEIRIATLSDFLWNPEQFSPEISLWRILTKKYGKETASELIELNDLYARVLENIMKLSKDNKEQKSLQKSTVAAIRKIRYMLDEMQTKPEKSPTQLISDLRQMCDELESALKTITEKSIDETEEMMTEDGFSR